jgi:Skp family chaperone for outer membrane proteins
MTFGQTKGVKIGYIDMEYILQNVPSYNEAKNQLELKAQKWKQEIELKNNEITKLKEALKAEQVLLTKELIAEKQEEITFQEKELLEYNQKRFGPNGDLLLQKTLAVKPLQDQIFTIVQDIAESKKYDFILDKSSDLTLLFAAKRYDISEQVLRTLTRAEQKEQLTKKQLKLQQEKDAKEDFIKENPEMLERQKILDDRKIAREKLAAEKKAALE